MLALSQNGSLGSKRGRKRKISEEHVRVAAPWTHAVFSVPTNVAKISLQFSFYIFMCNWDNDFQHLKSMINMKQFLLALYLAHLTFRNVFRYLLYKKEHILLRYLLRHYS